MDGGRNEALISHFVRGAKGGAFDKNCHDVFNALLGFAPQGREIQQLQSANSAAGTSNSQAKCSSQEASILANMMSFSVSDAKMAGNGPYKLVRFRIPQRELQQEPQQGVSAVTELTTISANVCSLGHQQPLNNSSSLPPQESVIGGADQLVLARALFLEKDLARNPHSTAKVEPQLQDPKLERSNLTLDCRSLICLQGNKCDEAADERVRSLSHVPQHPPKRRGEAGMPSKTGLSLLSTRIGQDDAVHQKKAAPGVGRGALQENCGQDSTLASSKKSSSPTGNSTLAVEARKVKQGGGLSGVTSNETESGQGNRIPRNLGAKKRVTGSIKRFPGKLHDMISYCENERGATCMNWIDGGTAFAIFDMNELKDILPIFFGHTRYSSMQRQLSTWHFSRIFNRSYPAYSHPLFLKGRKSDCEWLGFADFQSIDTRTLDINHLLKKQDEKQKKRLLKASPTPLRKGVSVEIADKSWVDGIKGPEVGVSLGTASLVANASTSKHGSLCQIVSKKDPVSVATAVGCFPNAVSTTGGNISVPKSANLACIGNSQNLPTGQAHGGQKGNDGVTALHAVVQAQVLNAILQNRQLTLLARLQEAQHAEKELREQLYRESAVPAQQPAPTVIEHQNVMHAQNLQNLMMMIQGGVMAPQVQLNPHAGVNPVGLGHTLHDNFLFNMSSARPMDSNQPLTMMGGPNFTENAGIGGASLADPLMLFAAGSNLSSIASPPGLFLSDMNANMPYPPEEFDTLGAVLPELSSSVSSSNANIQPNNVLPFVAEDDVEDLFNPDATDPAREEQESSSMGGDPILNLWGR